MFFKLPTFTKRNPNSQKVFEFKYVNARMCSLQVTASKTENDVIAHEGTTCSYKSLIKRKVKTNDLREDYC
jgi:hypothetical protein